MFKRNKRNDILPSTAYGTGGGGGSGLPFAGGGGSLDGSGRSIKMEAPVVKAWKKATGYTRGSYYALGTTLFMAFYGFRSLRYWNGMSCQIAVLSFDDALNCSFRLLMVTAIFSAALNRNFKIFLFLNSLSFCL